MIDVTCAIIINDKKILVTQRSEKMSLPLKWEFPGGKVEKNETPEKCIIREIKEELNLEIEIENKLESKTFNYEGFSINLIPFIAKKLSGDVSLIEHKSFLWLEVGDLKNLDWAAADIPILEDFLKYYYDTTGII